MPQQRWLKASDLNNNKYIIFMVTLIFSYVNSEDNSENNEKNINQNDRSSIQLDPKLRRALLRVLNKLEEQDKFNLNGEIEKEQNNQQSSNIVNEDDFIRYFNNNKETQEQLLGSLSSSTNIKNNDNINENDDNIKIEPRAPGEQIKFSLYQSNDDENQPDFRSGGTFTREASQSTIEEIKEPKTEEIIFEDKDTKYPSTNPTPQEAIFFQVPHPIEVPASESDKPTNDSLILQDTKYLQIFKPENNEFKISNNNNNDNTKQEEGTKTIIENIKSQNDEIISDNDDPVVQDDNLNDESSNSSKNLKHTVEFLTAPLLAAFTVQQDQLGLPKKVIPLNYKNTGAPLLLLDPQEEIAKQKELEEKRIQLEQELIEQQRKLKILQLQQLPLHQNSLGKLQEQTNKFEFHRNNQQFSSPPQIYDQQLHSQQQIYLQQNQQQQHQLLLENHEKQRLIQLEQAKLRQQQQDILLNSQQRQEQERLLLLKEQERVRLHDQQQQQQGNQQLPINFQNQQSQPQNINFQKSVDFQFRPTNPSPVQNPVNVPNPVQSSTFNHFHNFPQNSQQQQQFSPVNNFNNFQQIPQQPVNNNFNHFQTSPSIELNRVNRGESNRFVGNFGFNNNNNNNLPRTQSPSTDSQLQNLLFQSGIGNELPTTHEDLNIVSKVLSLNHETKQEQLQQQLQIKDQFHQSQFIPNEQQFTFNQQQQQFRPNNDQQQTQLQQQINTQQFRSNELQFKPNDHQQQQQFRQNNQQFRSNELQFKPNDNSLRSNIQQQFRPNNIQQFRSNEQRFRSNDQFFPSQEFRPSEQLFGEPSLKINKIVKAPSILIEPPLP